MWEGPAATQLAEVKGPGGKITDTLVLQGGGNQILLDPAQLKREGLGPRRKTGWGYRDFYR
ncbi:hypothetical protein ABRZ24_17525 [Brenneria populi]|uniref:Uncharacterized protein n=1 Tax=Brenneria populi TaxID=1505588 RepID=A0ABU6JVH2_9GAMM|nr:hypothetical protein [Brenneria populi Li et al. 2015]